MPANDYVHVKAHGAGETLVQAVQYAQDNNGKLINKAQALTMAAKANKKVEEIECSIPWYIAKANHFNEVHNIKIPKITMLNYYRIGDDVEGSFHGLEKKENVGKNEIWKPVLFEEDFICVAMTMFDDLEKEKNSRTVTEKVNEKFCGPPQHKVRLLLDDYNNNKYRIAAEYCRKGVPKEIPYMKGQPPVRFKIAPGEEMTQTQMAAIYRDWVEVTNRCLEGMANTSSQYDNGLETLNNLARSSENVSNNLSASFQTHAASQNAILSQLGDGQSYVKGLLVESQTQFNMLNQMYQTNNAFGASVFGETRPSPSVQGVGVGGTPPVFGAAGITGSYGSADHAAGIGGVPPAFGAATIARVPGAGGGSGIGGQATGIGGIPPVFAARAVTTPFSVSEGTPSGSHGGNFSGTGSTRKKVAPKTTIKSTPSTGGRSTTKKSSTTKPARTKLKAPPSTGGSRSSTKGTPSTGMTASSKPPTKSTETIVENVDGMATPAKKPDIEDDPRKTSVRKSARKTSQRNLFNAKEF